MPRAEAGHLPPGWRHASDTEAFFPSVGGSLLSRESSCPLSGRLALRGAKFVRVQLRPHHGWHSRVRALARGGCAFFSFLSTLLFFPCVSFSCVLGSRGEKYSAERRQFARGIPGAPRGFRHCAPVFVRREVYRRRSSSNKNTVCRGTGYKDVLYVWGMRGGGGGGLGGGHARYWRSSRPLPPTS